MDELVECVLPVRPRLAPDHGARRVVDALPGAGHVPEQDRISLECKRYQGLEILPIPIFCRSDIADNQQTSDHWPIEQYLPIHMPIYIGRCFSLSADISFYRQI